MTHLTVLFLILPAISISYPVPNTIVKVNKNNKDRKPLSYVGDIANISLISKDRSLNVIETKKSNDSVSPDDLVFLLLKNIIIVKLILAGVHERLWLPV